MGSRKALNCVACSRGHSYFSMSTSYRPQRLRLWMCRNSPGVGSRTQVRLYLHAL